MVSITTSLPQELIDFIHDQHLAFGHFIQEKLREEMIKRNYKPKETSKCK